MRPFAKPLVNLYHATLDERGPSMGALQAIQQRLNASCHDALEQLPFDHRPADMSVTESRALVLHALRRVRERFDAGAVEPIKRCFS